MTSSGTYNFSPSVGSLVLGAYQRIGVRRTELTAGHLTDGYNETNFLLSRWSALTPPNLWTVDLQTVSLVQGTATYNVDASTVMVLDAYIEYGTTPPQDRLIFPISRSEYAAYVNKTQQGVPTVFWFDRLLSPTITLWYVPDGTIPTLKYYRCTQPQDANLANGETPAIPYRFIDAMVAGLAHRLSRIYAPQLEQIRKADADEAWTIAATNDVENVALNILPDLSGFRSVW